MREREREKESGREGGSFTLLYFYVKLSLCQCLFMLIHVYV